MVDLALTKDYVKRNVAVRFFFKPYMNLRYKRGDRQYRKSADSSWLKSQHNRYRGKRCFIIGNGPSLKSSDLDLIAGEFSFASNGIYHLFEDTSWRPSHYIAVDRYFIESEANMLANINLPCVLVDLFAEKYLPKKSERVVFVNLHMDFFSLKKYTTTNISFSDRPHLRIAGGYTVTYAAMQLALFMGFTDIILLGIDHNYAREVTSQNRIVQRGNNEDHFFKDDHAKGCLYYEGVEYAYELAKEKAREKGVRIVNATRGGDLDIFERLSLEEVLGL